MHPTLRRSTIAVALASAFSPCLAADEAAVVVTATRQPQRANELLGDVTVIGREEIEQAGPSSSLADLLGRQPGVQIVSSGAPGSVSSLLLRGANSDHTLVLIDGLRVNSATLGSTSLSRIPLAQIERIEILRGPASSLYGSEAIGGVVQVFTRRGEGAPRVSAEAGYGSYGTADAGVGVSGSAGAVRYSLYANSLRSDGFSTIRNPANAAFHPDRDGFHNDSLSGSLSVTPAPGHEIGANFFYSSGRNKYDGGYNPATARLDYESGISVKSYGAYSRNRILPQWTSTLRLGRGTDDSTDYKGGNASSVFRTDQDQIAWQNDFTLPVGQALLALESDTQRVSSTSTFTVKERRLDALLAGWSGRVGDHRFQFNARRDSNAQFGGKTTGLAAYGYQFAPAWRAGISAATALKIPSFNDLYFPNTAFVGSGNPNLRPEFSRNREFSLHYDGTQHSASATTFRNRISDLIQWQETPPGSFFYMPQNVAAAVLTGWTFAYAGQWGGYEAKASVDLLDPRDESTGKLLLRRAREQGAISLSRVEGAWSWGTEWQAVGPRFNDVANLKRLGGYGLVNLFGAYRLERDWSLFARANNLFDKRYEQIADYGTAGASLFVGVRYTPR